MTGSMFKSANFSGKFIKPDKKTQHIAVFLGNIIAVVLILIWGKEPGIKEITGTVLVVATFYIILFFFLLQFRQEVLSVVLKTFFILLAILTFLIITRIVSGLAAGNIIFLVPFAIIPVIIRTFYDARLALFILLITIMLAGFMVEEPFIFILMSFISGMVAIFTLTNNFRKSRLLFTSLMVIISNTVLYSAVLLMWKVTDIQFDPYDFLMLAGNGFLILLSYPLILLFEQEFLLVSDTTLLKLADINQPLLRKLAVEAPGSFQHSLQVANLAEEAARTIGANVHLVRAGELYHDIGKIARPTFFIEYQVDGLSPHDKMDPRDSAKIITSHVKNGMVLAKNYKIPAPVIDFIRTHHGTTIAYFFYKKFTDLYPEEVNRESLFAYPGPKPFSKETAIVMMADAVEASSRSLHSYTEENISDLVERIIYLQEQDGQFANVPITFRDMSDIKSAFKKRLTNIYHARIVYPERT
ncbi:MAG: HDIG domain-containing protein [Bacteroidales bacterium]|nr:HDIG domain-containing protein [Bacteroidales bacterium]